MTYLFLLTISFFLQKCYYVIEDEKRGFCKCCASKHSFERKKKSSIKLSIKSRQGNRIRGDIITMETNGFSGGKQCVFTPANENSYVPTALGSYVWKTTESPSLVPHIFMRRACKKKLENGTTSVLSSIF